MQASFGFKTVAEEAKETLVGGVFSSVASRYDVMNDAMSAGLHRLWKDTFVGHVNVPPTAAILDLAGGTGDIAVRLHKRTGAEVTICDINADMLSVGRARQFDKARAQGLHWTCGNAEMLPVADRSQDVITIAFGLRNVTHIDQALAEAYRALKPGGQFLCLEFSKVPAPLAKVYDLYSFHVIPRVGQLLAGDRDAYQYLVESIRMFPAQEELAARMRTVGFSQVSYTNLTMGVVAVHRGWRV